MAVFVLDKRGKPLMPCSEKRARKLLEARRARVHLLTPFTIRVVDRTVSDCVLQPLKIKLDPGSKTTGIGKLDAVENWRKPTLKIKAAGRGSYQRTRLNAYGFPRGYLTREKRINGFQTGDMVIATVTKGKKTGIHKGRVAVRASGNFNIQTAQGVVQGIAYKYCQLIQRSDGYAYA